jgi:ubiquinone/menaquinone biosynthesis C-methylase UbiE
VDRYRDQKYLLEEQYKDPTNFSARVELHRRFSVNRYGFHRWVFDHFQLEPESQVLELGCGPGILWSSNLERIPPGWAVTLSDFSPGMLQAARSRLPVDRFTFAVADAQSLPVADACFDAVIANHMLYHVPDLNQALHEIRRVLKPRGHFYASTFGREDGRELLEFIRMCRTDSLPSGGAGPRHPAQFVLENGREVLSPYFAEVTRFDYDDALEVTESAPLLAYALSTSRGSRLTQEEQTHLSEIIGQELERRGSIHITKYAGLFAARVPSSAASIHEGP